MSIIESPSYNLVLHEETVDLGKLYFFKYFLIAEFNEGINISFDNFKETMVKIENYFGSREFGFIANRIHSYSIVITDAPLFNNRFKNLNTYATVTYSSFASKVFEMENHFFNFNRRNFNELEKAIQWTQESLEGTNEAL